jgi:hypothetical protein
VQKIDTIKVLLKFQHDIIHSAEQLGLPLDTVIAEVITALKIDAERLGLAGTAHSTPP